MQTIKMTTSYNTRQGRRIQVAFTSRTSAEARLAFLDADEERTKKVAPTDSGDTRRDYQAEALAIRIMLRNAE